MCGIAGAWTPRLSPDETLSMVTRMTDGMRERGPDADGHYSDREAGVCLGHRRLSILDLSEQGRQPRVSQSGRYVLSYNGEIYNFRELREELASNSSELRFESECDTEVVLAAIETWGLSAAIKRFVGMFAFALWDRQERRLSVARDRLGIKPACVAKVPGGVLFASQPKSFLQHEGFSRALSTDALSAYVKSSVVPAPLCIYRDAHKVLPGTIVHLDEPNLDSARTEVYWDAAQVAHRGQSAPLTGNTQELRSQLDELLTEAVRCRLVSDVPLGAFLSGGVDSSTVVALMRKLGGDRIQTFTIGTHEKSHDESGDARAIADHLGTDHHELIATPEDALAVVDDLADFYDEPFADSSQIPTYLVSRLARQSVTVSLSGDGGDELFGGYNRHRWGPRISSWNEKLPLALRKRAADLSTVVKPQTVDSLFERLVPKKLSVRLPSDKLSKIARALRADSEEALYESLAAANALPSEVLVELERGEPTRATTSPSVPLAQIGDAAHRIMYQDMVGYLPNDILTKVDRASMAVSLEARVPLLDHRVVEFAWQLPTSAKIRDGQGKWLLRQVLYQYVPRELIDRPKSGFGIPVASWLRGPLRDWGESLLDERRLREQGIFRAETLREKWNEHQSGARDWNQHLWDMLVFQSWWDRWQ